MFVSSIDSASEVQMDFTSGIFLMQEWNDPRLAFVSQPGIEYLVVSTEDAEKIWMPDTSFSNEKPDYTGKITEAAVSTFLRIGADGAVMKSTKVSVTVACELDLRRFPMDSQTCNLEMQSSK
jgi:hypothetical protein